MNIAKKFGTQSHSDYIGICEHDVFRSAAVHVVVLDKSRKRFWAVMEAVINSRACIDRECRERLNLRHYWLVLKY